MHRRPMRLYLRRNDEDGERNMGTGEAKTVWVAGATLAMALLGGCNRVDLRDDVVARADAHFATGELEAAQRLYHEALAADREDPHALDRAGTLALWRNDPQAAIPLLEAARQRRGWLARRWPMRAEADVRLAITYARAGRLPEAAALLHAAAGPVPVGSLSGLMARARQLELFGERRPYALDGAAQTVLPFVVTDPLPVVTLSVNGGAPAQFVIDTGGEGLILDPEFARSEGAVIVGEGAEEYAGGKPGRTGYGKVERVDLGGIRVRDVPVSTLDMQPIRDAVFPGMAIRGIVGTGLLMPFVATIDYPGQRLLLRRPDSAAAQPAPAAAAFPLWLVDTHLLFARGRLNDLEPRPMLIDTGLADAGFLTCGAIFERAGVAIDWSRAAYGAGGGGKTKGVVVSVDRVTLGDGPGAVTRRDLRGVAFEDDMSLFRGALGFEVGGLISHQFFRDHAVTFDFGAMRLLLQQ